MNDELGESKYSSLLYGMVFMAFVKAEHKKATTLLRQPHLAQHFPNLSEMY